MKIKIFVASLLAVVAQSSFAEPSYILRTDCMTSSQNSFAVHGRKSTADILISFPENGDATLAIDYHQKDSVRYIPGKVRIFLKEDQFGNMIGFDGFRWYIPDASKEFISIAVTSVNPYKSRPSGFYDKQVIMCKRSE